MPIIDPPAVITNGTVSLGVNMGGQLIASDGTGFSGVTFNATGNDGTRAGCECEGWGAADATSSTSGWADQDWGGANNLLIESFLTTPTTAVSTVVIPSTGSPKLRVIHDYHPSADTPNLYEVTVTIENLSGATVSPLYRRLMDWDAEPTAFDEWVSIQGSEAAVNVLRATNNGFESPDPLVEPGPIGFGTPDLTGDFVDQGPADHGALFDFEFADLAPGATEEFSIYYGAAATRAGAVSALAAAEAEVYSLGMPNNDDSTAPDDTVNTFAFGFKNVGGVAIACDPDAWDLVCSAQDSGPLVVDDFQLEQGTAHQQSTYTGLPVVEEVNSTGMVAWHSGSGGGGACGDPNVAYPLIVFNITGSAQTCGASIDDFPDRSATAHPSDASPLIVTWVSPVDGTVAVTGSVTDVDANAGNGVLWSLDKGDTTIASDVVQNEGKTLSAGAGGAALESIPVEIGDELHLLIDANGNFDSDSTRITLHIEPSDDTPLPTTATTLTVTPGTTKFGQQPTLKTTVARIGSSVKPSGTVTFTADGLTLGTKTLVNGKATLKPTAATSGGAWPLAPGSYDVVAHYNGDGALEDTESSSAPSTLTVQKADVAITVSKPGAAAVGDGGTLALTYGEPVTVLVKAVLPGKGVVTGSVDISDGGTPLGNFPLVKGKVALGAIGAGSRNLEITYASTTSFNGGSATIGVNVAPRSTDLVLKASNLAPAAGKNVTLTASIVNPPATGFVQFYDGAAPLGAPVALGVNKAVLKTTALSDGAPHSITAVYAGDANNTGDTSNAVVVDG